MSGVVVIEKRSVLVVRRSAQVIVVKRAVSRVIKAGVRLVTPNTADFDIDLTLLYSIAKL